MNPAHSIADLNPVRWRPRRSLLNPMPPLKKSKFDLETPCLVLDVDILEQNIKKMQLSAQRAGKNLRPHVKTHKCSSLAMKQVEAGAIGVCVAKLSEAEALADAGLDTILITGPIASPGKAARLVELTSAVPSLMAVIDHPDHIALLDNALKKGDRSMDVLLDVDVGLNRTGARPPEALALAEQVLSCPRLRLCGIQAYAGQVQHIPAYDERKKTSLRCLQEAVPIFRSLKERIPTCTIFSASGTGTFDIDIAIPEVTELQVGSYVCMDTEYLEIGSADNETRFVSFAPALRLLTTVVSASHSDFVTVDAGLKTLYRDGGIPKVIGPGSTELVYDWFGDEYGRVSRTGDSDLPVIGSVLELITSHCDPTINLFDRYVLTRGDTVTGTWPIDLRGCSQ